MDPIEGKVWLSDDPDPTFLFGKYAGETVNNVIGDDPSYVSWIVYEHGDSMCTRDSEILDRAWAQSGRR